MISQLEELQKTINALTLRPEHAALIAQCQGLAAAIDASPDKAALWREYRPALDALLAAGEAEVDDGEAAFLRLLSTPVGDTEENGTPDARAGSRRDRAASGPAADAVADAGGEHRLGAAS